MACGVESRVMGNMVDDGDEMICIQKKRKKIPKSMLNRIVVEDDDDLLNKISPDEDDEDDEDDNRNHRPEAGVVRRTYTEDELKELEAICSANAKRWLQEADEECKDIPPLYSDEVGEVDTCDAFSIEIDVSKLDNKDQYECLVHFIFNCRRKCALRLFTHPGDPRPGGVGVTYKGGQHRELYFYEKLANRAITEYNNRNKNGNLKLEQIIRVNYVLGSGLIYYLTFSALDDQTGKSSTYQAAVSRICGKYFVGILRDVLNDKTLAILHLKGGEDDLNALRKLVPQ